MKLLVFRNYAKSTQSTRKSITHCKRSCKTRSTWSKQWCATQQPTRLCGSCAPSGSCVSSCSSSSTRSTRSWPSASTWAIRARCECTTTGSCAPYSRSLCDRCPLKTSSSKALLSTLTTFLKTRSDFTWRFLSYPNHKNQKISYKLIKVFTKSYTMVTLNMEFQALMDFESPIWFLKWRLSDW